jgi:hypothetical protein
VRASIDVLNGCCASPVPSVLDVSRLDTSHKILEGWCFSCDVCGEGHKKKIPQILKIAVGMGVVSKSQWLVVGKGTCVQCQHVQYGLLIHRCHVLCQLRWEQVVFDV